jgi:hypothetical protein
MSCGFELFGLAGLSAISSAEAARREAREQDHYDFFMNLLANPVREIPKINKGNNPGGRVYDHKSIA